MEGSCDEQTLQGEYDDLRTRKEEIEHGIQSCIDSKPGDSLFETIKNDIIEDEGTDVDAEEMTFNVLDVRKEELEEELLVVVEKIDEVKSKAKSLFGKEFNEDSEEFCRKAAVLQELKEADQSDWKRAADDEIDELRLLCPFCVDPTRENTTMQDGKCFCKNCNKSWTLGKRQMLRMHLIAENECAHEDESEIEEEVHVLGIEGDEHLNAITADTVQVFVDEDDQCESCEPLKTLKSGAIRHEFGRVDPHMVKHMMSHQVEAVEFTMDAFAKGHGCCLALSMGMGKTLSTLAILDVIGARVPGAYMLIITPAVITLNWEREYDKWQPPNVTFQGAILKMSSVAERLLKNTQKTGGIIVTTVDTFRLHLHLFGNPTIMIIDEGHRIKNPRTQLFAAVDTIETPYKLALTGTPLQNNLQECFTLMNWISPGLLGSWKQFQNCFGSDIENESNYAKSQGRVHMLKQKLDTVVFRRDNLASILPKKREFRVALLVPAVTFESSNLLPMYSETLKQTMQTKLNAITTMLHEIARHSKKTVVFSGRKQVLYSLKEIIDGPLLVGETPPHDRQSAIDLFQADDSVNVIYISTMTGAQGINLTAATEVIIADASFNPTWEMQAVCRCWRIGQVHPVNVYRMIGADSMEDDIYKQQLAKFSLFARIVDDREIQSLASNLSPQTPQTVSLSLKTVDYKSMKHDDWGESMAKHVLTSIQNMVCEVTWHDFDESDSEISVEAKQRAINDYNMICMQHSRLLPNENDELVDVKPHAIFAGQLLVPPFAPVLSNTTCSTFVDILPVSPSYDRFELEQEFNGSDSGSQLYTLDMRNITKLNITIAGSYRWRVRGFFSKQGAENVSPWSDWSTTFTL